MQSPLRWTCLSTRNLAGTLTAAGRACSAPTVARLLKAEGYSLQGNAKVAEGAQHPDRDAQFRYIAARAREFLDAWPAGGLGGCQEKEKVGQFANGGAEWRPKGRPERVNVHDFPSGAIGKAIPYGICDLGANAGVGQRRHRPRHLRVRRGDAAPLVAGRRAGPLSRCAAAADLR